MPLINSFRGRRRELDRSRLTFAARSGESILPTHPAAILTPRKMRITPYFIDVPHMPRKGFLRPRAGARFHRPTPHVDSRNLHAERHFKLPTLYERGESFLAGTMQSRDWTRGSKMVLVRETDAKGFLKNDDFTNQPLGVCREMSRAGCTRRTSHASKG